MKTPQQIKNEVEKGCGTWSEGKVKGVTFQTQCGNTGFKDKICLCEICQAKLSILTEYDKSIKEMINNLKYKLDFGFDVGEVEYKQADILDELLSKLSEEKQDENR